MTSASRGRVAVLVVVTWALLCAAVVGWGWLLIHVLGPSVDPWEDDLARSFADARTSPLGAVAAGGTFLGDTWSAGSCCCSWDPASQCGSEPYGPWSTSA